MSGTLLVNDAVADVLGVVVEIVSTMLMHGICDDEQILGCTTQQACNYDPAAVNDGRLVNSPHALTLAVRTQCLQLRPDAEFEDGSCDYAHVQAVKIRSVQL